MVKLFRETVTAADFWVSSHDRISDFYASSWQRGESPVPMLVIRVVLSAMALAILLWSLVEAGSPFWLIYLTNWGLLLVTMMMLSGLAVSSIAVIKKPYDTLELPWYVSMYWFLHNVAVSIALMITALYWILLYDPEGDDGRRMFWLDLATHGFNSCIAVAEVACARTPLRLFHFYQPLGVGLWYAAFTAIYYAAGGTDGNDNPYIYEVLYWKYGKRSAALVGISIAGLLVIYVLLWLLVVGRDRATAALFRTSSHNLPPTPPDNIMHTRIV